VIGASQGGTSGCALWTRGIIVGVGRIFEGADGFATINICGHYKSTLPTHELGMVSNQLGPQEPPLHKSFVPQSKALGFCKNNCLPVMAMCTSKMHAFIYSCT